MCFTPKREAYDAKLKAIATSLKVAIACVVGYFLQFLNLTKGGVKDQNFSLLPSF
jgi:hypothetical protein